MTVETPRGGVPVELSPAGGRAGAGARILIVAHGAGAGMDHPFITGFSEAMNEHSERKRAKLHHVKEELVHRRYLPIPEQGQWLASVVRGHCAYYAVPGNYEAVAAFCRG